MKTNPLCLILIAACLTLTSQRAYAQCSPAPYDTWEYKESDQRAYQRVKERFTSELAFYDYPAVFRGLQKDLESSSRWTKTEPVYQKLDKAFSVLNERFTRFDHDLKTAENREAFLKSYETGLFQRLDFDYFEGKDFAVSSDDLQKLPQNQFEDFLYRAEIANCLLTDLKRPLLKENVQAIRNAERRWDLFMKDGMSQYPWEAAVNGWIIGGGSIEYPPTRQWIVAHPELGVEVSTHKFADMTAKEALLIEALGHVWYRWKDKNDPAEGLRWWGISAAATLRDDMGPGLGLVVHYGRLITAGITWHREVGQGGWFEKSPYVVFGIDLFRFAEDRVPRYQQKVKEALAAREKLF